MFNKILRVINVKNNNSLFKLQYFSCLSARNVPNLKANLVQSVHKTALIHSASPNFCKIFVDRENTYAFNIIETSNGNKLENGPRTTYESQISNQEDFERFMDQNWREKSATEIVSAFHQILNHCVSNDLNISLHIFDKLTDGLMDNVEKLTDDQLGELLDLLYRFPPCESFKSHNFHDIWSALDDICCWRLVEWDRDKMFSFGDKWFKLNLGKVGDFMCEVIKRLGRSPKRLSQQELVHIFFYMNLCRRSQINFEYESAVEDKIEKMSLNEIGIIALGYFKTETQVKIPLILSVMLRKAKESKELHEMTLCAILKIVRFSSNPNLADQMYDFLDHITPQMDRLSNLCLLHIALLGTSLQIAHYPSLKKAAQRIAENIQNVEQVRLKEIERILLPLSMFDYDPKTTPDIFQAAFKELHEERRLAEMVKYPRCLPSALLFLSVRNIYSYELMDRVLHPDFIMETYGTVPKSIPREIFCLDVSSEIECPQYEGNRLDLQKRYKVVKWKTAYTPRHDQKKRISNAEKVFLDVIDCVNEISAGKMFIDHVLPHYVWADIILCKNKQTGHFVQPAGFENYILGDVMRPSDTDKLHWYALVVLGWNNTIRNTTKPVGNANTKLRQLKQIGYKPISVIWNQYMPLMKDDKKKYILERIER